MNEMTEQYHFEEEIKSGKQFIHPIYFQHDGNFVILIFRKFIQLN